MNVNNFLTKTLLIDDNYDVNTKERSTFTAFLVFPRTKVMMGVRNKQRPLIRKAGREQYFLVSVENGH